MIISASRRTDIPAFHSSWFMERIREGSVFVRNPFNPSQGKIVSLRPEDVDAIVFWTRNSHPLLPYLKELDERGFNYIFLYTITGYGPPLEESAPAFDDALRSFKELTERVGPERIIWRFDPIVFPDGEEVEWIISRFEKIATALRHNTRQVIISFLDFYPKVVRRLEALEKRTGFKLRDVAQDTAIIRHIAFTLKQVAQQNNLGISSCAEKIELETLGILPGKCIDNDVLNRLFGLNLTGEKDKNQRPLCRCTTSQDIGEYNTCHYQCTYCYATGR